MAASESEARSRIGCTFPNDGTYVIRIFGEEAGTNVYSYDGQIEVNSRR